MNYDVVALGELLIDFIENSVSNQGNPVFEANPGGAPCNVLAMLNNLGKKTGFIGKVGDDFFGNQLKSNLETLGIDTSNLIMDKETNTTLAFVKTLADGDRDFSFYRNPGADMMLTKDEIKDEMIQNTKIFHFGTLSMTHEKVREATKHALDIAKKSGAIISFDPNLREPLWDSLEDAKEQFRYGMGFCHVLKISDNEIQWFTGVEDYTEGARILQEEFNIPLILLSMGKAGSRAYYQGKMVEAKPFIQEDIVETTGAGDTFCGCCLSFILKYGLYDLNQSRLEEMLMFANAAASIITTRKGAFKVMPQLGEIRQIIQKG